MQKRQGLTKGLAIAGTVMLWLPFAWSVFAVMVLAPLAGPVPDVGLPVLLAVGAMDLYPVALLGGCLLMWSAVRARSHRRVIGWSLAAQIAGIATSLARNATIASGGPTAGSSWPETITLLSTAVLWSGWIVVALAGVSLVYSLVSRVPEGHAGRPRRGYVMLGTSLALVLLCVLSTLAYIRLYKPAELAGRVAAASLEPSPVPGFGEPNDDKAHATVLTPGQQLDASLETSADVDVYRIDHYEPVRNGLVRMVGAISVLETDARGQVIGESYSDPVPKGTPEESLRTGASLNFDPGDVPWPLYFYVKRAPGYTAKAVYRILVPRAR